LGFCTRVSLYHFTADDEQTDVTDYCLDDDEQYRRVLNPVVRPYLVVKRRSTMTHTTRHDQPERNPCHLVRNSCMDYVQTDACRSLVTIHSEAIPALVESIRQQQKPTKEVVEWDEEHWHYRCEQNEGTDTPIVPWPQSIRKERIALYILALDAINFSFWTKEDEHVKYEYEDLAVTLTNMAQADHEYQHEVIQESRSNGVSPLSSQFVFSPSSLQQMTVDRMTALFQKHHDKGWVPPNIQERCQIWNEIGSVLQQAPFNGSISSLLDMAHQSAPNLVQLLIDYFPNFRDDTATHYENSNQNRPVVPSSSRLPRLFFYKRAQICVGDWNAALSAQGIPLNLNEMDQITTFADYRVPQLLRHVDVLRYSPQLSNQIDGYMELAPYSDEELAIRASTVAAVEMLVEHLQRKCMDVSWNAMQTDWYLWQVGERMDQACELLPHHRVRTTFY
jgi:Potential Queuosine, Q, salvage protein family